MKTKILLVATVSALITGCSASPVRSADIGTIISMQVDCTNADLQVRYLERNRALNMNNAFESQPEVRQYNTLVAQKIWTIRSRCQ